MTDAQLFIAVGIPVFTILFGILLNNYRLNDMKELLRAEIKVNNGDIKAEIAAFRAEVLVNRVEIATVRAEMRQYNAELRR